LKKVDLPKHGFLGLLLCLVSILAIAPFFYGFPAAPTIIRIFFTGVLIFSVYTFSKKKDALIISSILVVPAFVSSWLSQVSPTPFLLIIKDCSNILFFSYAIFIILLKIFRTKKITSNLIYGSVCVYLLIGLVWAFIFSLLENTNPGSFNIPASNFESMLSGNTGLNTIHLFLYYSYTTLTTLGYGDITPITPPAQSISSLEAIVGQFYLTILVARLVGLHLTSKNDP
jgi:voltage-gated potassium channel